MKKKKKVYTGWIKDLYEDRCSNCSKIIDKVDKQFFKSFKVCYTCYDELYLEDSEDFGEFL